MEFGVLIGGCVVLGTVIGSFLTVVVDRVPDGRSIVQPPSACGACNHRLGVLDLVPVLSWLALRGKCRHCGAPIGVEALMIELVTAALFCLMAWKFGVDARLPAYCILVAGLVALTWIDLAHFRLPREVSYTTLGLGGTALAVAAFVRHEPARLLYALAGAAIALAFMGLVYVASRGGMGDGDVRLAPLLGFFMGYLELGLVPVGLFLGFTYGAVVGVGAMVFGSAGRKTALPFGPFLATGTVTAIVIGGRILDVLLYR